MKKLLLAMFVALLMLVWKIKWEYSTPSDPVVSLKVIDWDDPETLDKILAEAIDKDDLKEGPETRDIIYYAPNQKTPYTGWVKRINQEGQLSMLGQYKNGKANGLCSEWYESGQRKSVEVRFGVMMLISADVWKPNGEKCPVTNVKNGNGIVVGYKEDGSEEYRLTYKDRKQVWNLPPRYPNQPQD